jgi:hypothetical protein
VHLIKEIESSAERLPESFRVQVLRKLEQARRGMEAGLDMTGVLKVLGEKVEAIKKKCGQVKFQRLCLQCVQVLNSV